MKNTFLILGSIIALFLVVGVLSYFYMKNQQSSPAQSTTPDGPLENQALIKAALADFDAKKYDAALEKLRMINKSLPDDPFVMNLLGAAYTKKKDYPAAQKCFEKALEKQPDFFPAKFNIGEILFLQRRYPEALEYFDKMQAVDRRNELIQFKIVLCELQLGDKEAAAKTIKTIKYPGDTPAWYYAQAAWESKNGNKQKALDYLTGAKSIFGSKTALFDETFDDLGIRLR